MDIKLFSLLDQVILYEDDRIIQHEWAEQTTRLRIPKRRWSKEILLKQITWKI